MLKKPAKKDASAPRSYRPITLEETFGKLLEKMMAARLQHWAEKKKWVADGQFGGRRGRAVSDAMEALLGNIQDAHNGGQVYTLIAMDVQGYFNNIRHEDINARLEEMGAPACFTDWVMSFVGQRRVAVSFDGYTGPLLEKPDLGVLQGSPLSPILLIFTTSKALLTYRNNVLGFKVNALGYMDDYTAGVASDSVAIGAKRASRIYERMERKFKKLDIKMEPTKTEIQHYIRVVGASQVQREGESRAETNRRVKREADETPMKIKVQSGIGSEATVTTVMPSISLRWLGIFLDKTLNFTDHVTRLCNKARSTLVAL